MNGLVTYDRKVIKLHEDRVTATNRSTWLERDKWKGQMDNSIPMPSLHARKWAPRQIVVR